MKALSEKIKRQDMEKLLETIMGLMHKFDKELADSVLEVSARANRKIINELRGDGNMCNALLEIMEPEINEIADSKVHKAILNAVKSFRDLGHSDEEIKRVLMKNYDLSLEEIESYLK